MADQPIPLMSPPNGCDPDVFLAFVGSLMTQHFRVLAQAEAEGHITGQDARAGTMTMGILRAVDRIADLPDDRDLTKDEEALFQSALWQIVANAACLLVELPMDQMVVMVAGFDADAPQ